MTSPGEPVYLDAGERRIALSSPDRILWPAIGFTKRNLADYYAAIAPALLPHLVGRPVTFKRAHEGINGHWWYQTECPHPPPWVETAPVPAATSDRVWNYCVVRDGATLLWLANLGCIELHPLLARSSDLTRAAAVVFDLDPGQGCGLVQCAEIALMLRALLEAEGLMSFVKTSGASGIHVTVPLDPGAAFEATAAFAANMSAAMVRLAPDRVTDQMAKATRAGKVFIDWRQNGPYKSLAAPYSLRLMTLPLVSVPLTWTELEDALDGEGQGLLFLPSEVLARVANGTEPWAAVATTKQTLTA